MNTHAIGDNANKVAQAYNKALVFSEDPVENRTCQIIDTSDIVI